MLRLLKMLVLPLVAGSMIAGKGCCLLMHKLLNCLDTGAAAWHAQADRKPLHQAAASCS